MCSRHARLAWAAEWVLTWHWTLMHTTWHSVACMTDGRKMDSLEEIVLSPDQRLSEECAAGRDHRRGCQEAVRRMLRAMYAADGCGLAGPQVGVLQQVVVIDCDYGHGKRNPYVLINPKVIIADGDDRESGEGCLSFPGITVPRHASEPTWWCRRSTSTATSCSTSRRQPSGGSASSTRSITCTALP